MCFKNFCLGQRLRTFVQKLLISTSVLSKTLRGGGGGWHAAQSFWQNWGWDLRTSAQKFLTSGPIQSSGINIQTAQKISNSRKIARIAPIWTKLGQNRSQRWKLSFKNVFRATRAQKTRFQKFFRASRSLNIYRWTRHLPQKCVEFAQILHWAGPYKPWQRNRQSKY